MELGELNLEQLKELTQKTEEKDPIRQLAKHIDIAFSPNIGTETLKTKILSEIDGQILAAKMALEEDEIPDEAPKNDPVALALASQIARDEENKDDDVHVERKVIRYTVAEMLEMDGAQVKDDKLRRQVIRTQALRLLRVQIANNDPNESMVPGMMFSIYSKYTGKVAKYIPFGEENEAGYHLPKILYDDLITHTYNMRKEKMGKNGIKQYNTVKMRKYNVSILDPLTAAELKNLANSQEGRGAIDRSK